MSSSTNRHTFRNSFPVTMYAACGTQADHAARNKLTVMKLSEMHKTYRKAENDEEDGSDSEGEGEDSEDEVRGWVRVGLASWGVCGCGGVRFGAI